MVKNFLLVALGGALGSMLRYGCTLLVAARNFPVAVLCINIAGSFLIGCVIAASSRYTAVGTPWTLFLATGICGGFTTFSAFSMDNLLLLQQGRIWLLLLNIMASVCLGIAAAAIGFKLINGSIQ